MLKKKKVQITYSKLGYGGTKTEMERLIKDASKLDKSVKAGDLSFGNIVKAIHAVQKNLDITGTTAKEASTTISGSFNSMKSAWSNLLPAMIEGGESFDQCIDNLVDSAETFLKNLKPVLTKALSGVGDLIDRLGPILAEHIPTLVNDLLPPLIRAATKIVAGLIKELPNIVRTLVPELIKAIYEGFSGKELTDGTVEALKGKVDKLMPVILGIAGALAGFKVFAKLKGTFDGISNLFKLNSEASGSIGKGGGLFGSLAKTPTKTILKGMGNLAIILGGATILTAAFMAVAPSIAKLSDFKSVLKTIAVIGLLGLLGTALAELAGKIGLIPVSTVTKGLANMAIVLGGLGALTAVFMWLAPEIAKLSDFRSILKVVTLIGILGTVGSVLSVFAGIVGLIPTAIVLTGLANIALIIGGLAGIVTAFGGLGKIPGFTEFIDTGGEVLTKLFNILGEIVGSVIGGVGEGITNSLPTMGKNLSEFAKSLKPMFDTFSGVDMTGVGNFLSAFGEFMLLMAGEKALSFVTGKTNYKDLGKQLTDFAESSKGFFDTVAQMSEAGFNNAQLFFNALAGVKGLPKEGGIASWFTGTIAYESLSNGLAQLSNENVKKFFAFCAEIKPAGFENAKGLFNALAEVKGLPKEGGIVSWFTGDIAYESLSNGLGQLSSEKVRGFFGWLSSVDPSVFEKTKLFFSSLAEVKGLPKEGGITQWFTGSAAEGIASLTDKLPAFGEAVASFYNSISQISDFGKIGQLFTALAGIDGAVESEGGFFNWVKDAVGGDSKTGLQLLGEALKSFGDNVKGFFNQINKLDIGKLQTCWSVLKEMGSTQLDFSGFDASFSDMVTIVSDAFAKIVVIIAMQLTIIKQLINNFSLASAGQSMMNSLIQGLNSKKLAVISVAASIASAIKSQFSSAVSSVNSSINRMINGANYVLSALGSTKKLSAYSYANGTSGHPGGNAIVNDGRGAELVQMPNGNAFIPSGRNVFIPNAPRGMKVFNAEQTATIMGKDTPTFHYAKGNIDVWSYINNATGLADKIVENYVGKINTSNFAGSATQGAVDTVKPPMASFLKKAIDELGGILVATCKKYLGVPYVWGGTSPRGFDCSGLMQYVYAQCGKSIPRTAATQFAGGIPIPTPRPGDLVFFKGALGTTSRPGHVGMFIGNGKMIHAPQTGDVVKIANAFRSDYLGARRFENGGIATSPSVFGEAGAEMAIPLSKNKRKRGLNLWERTGDLLGAEYTPENSSSHSKAQVTEYNTYSPQFTLNINGAADEKSIERKVKKFVREALEETFDSMNRKSPRLIEI